MKIVINKNGLVEDRPLREVERLINMGLAHLPEVEPVNWVPSVFSADLSNITFEDLNGIASFSPKEEVTDIDIIEPIPIDKYVSFDEPKKAKKKLFHR